MEAKGTPLLVYLSVTRFETRGRLLAAVRGAAAA
jgi:hypothetical protein